MSDPTEAGVLLERLDSLARFSADDDAITRLYLTPEHRSAAAEVGSWMRQAGMTVTVDAVGTVVGRYEANRPGAPVLLLGSHIDTVRDAGRYDGTLGVVAAISVVAALHAGNERLPFVIEVLAFGDEEGVRFPRPMAGSRAIAGTFDFTTLDDRDGDAVQLRDALQSFGCDPDAIGRIRRDPARTLGYLELHIEQGPVLESLDLPLGIVTAINGASRFNVTVTGTAGHAGTVPMQLRNDALTAAAEMILAIERVGRSRPDLVATVGELTPRPGAVNVIAGSAVFTIDVRSPRDTDRHATIEEIRQELAAIAGRRGTTVDIVCTYDTPQVDCDPHVIGALTRAVASVGISPHLLPSGAGHDAMAVAVSLPVGMLFLRCRGGISHNPAESIRADDAEIAVAALLQFVRDLDPEAIPHR